MKIVNYYKFDSNHISSEFIKSFRDSPVAALAYLPLNQEPAFDEFLLLCFIFLAWYRTWWDTSHF